MNKWMQRFDELGKGLRLGSISEKEKCARCGGGPILSDHASGECVCASCGLVVQEVEKNDVMHDVILKIGHEPISEKREVGIIIGVPGYKAKNFDEARLRKTNVWTDSEGKFVRLGLNEIERLATVLHIPRSTAARAAQLYEKARKKKLVKNRPTGIILAACIYIACREAGIPRTINEVAEKTRFSKKEVVRAYRNLVFGLDLQVTPPDPVKLIPQIASKLGLPEETVRRATGLLKEYRKEPPEGNHPLTIAGATLYVASILDHRHVTQEQVAFATGLTVTSIRERSFDIIRKLGIAQRNRDLIIREWWKEREQSRRKLVYPLGRKPRSIPEKLLLQEEKIKGMGDYDATTT